MNIAGIEIDVPPELEAQTHGAYAPYLRIANGPDGSGVFVSLRVFLGAVPDLKNPLNLIKTIGVWYRHRAMGNLSVFEAISYPEERYGLTYHKVKKFFPLCSTDMGWHTAVKVAEKEFVPELAESFRKAIKDSGGKVLLRGTKLDQFFMQVIDMMPLQPPRAKVYSPVSWEPDHTTYGEKGYKPLPGQSASMGDLANNSSPKPAKGPNDHGDDDFPDEGGDDDHI